MNNLSRIITGILCIVFGLIFTFLGFNDISPDYIVVIFGLFFVVVGVYIIFNKQEDKVEEIKEAK